VVLLADFCVAFFVLIVPSCAGSPMNLARGGHIHPQSFVTQIIASVQ
jgi:hypothetical protein